MLDREDKLILEIVLLVFGCIITAYLYMTDDVGFCVALSLVLLLAFLAIVEYMHITLRWG